MIEFSTKILVLLFYCLSLMQGLACSNLTDYPVYDGDDDFTLLISGGYRPEMITGLKLAKYVVSIRTARPTAYFGDNHFCAGVIIASRLIVTAAHCIMDSYKIVTRPRRLVVVAGTPNRLLKTDKTVELQVEQVLSHEKYIRKGANDIALLRLKESIPDDNNQISVIPLIDHNIRPGRKCTVLGWGQLFYRGPYAADIVYADLMIFSNEECSDVYKNVETTGMLCAANRDDWEVDTCRGDSGGPLICTDKLAGIVSWGAPCGASGLPGVFSNVFYHRNWIEMVNGSKRSMDLAKLCIILVLALGATCAASCTVLWIIFL